MENTQNETTHAHSTPQVVTNKKNISNFITPIAIVIAGIVIAAALYTRGDLPSKTIGSNKNVVSDALSGPKAEFTDIKSTDHIRGSKDAKVVIIEYSDTECPFCKVYHETMKKIYAEFGKDNQVAWVYRHFPISYGDRPLHKKSAKEAEATECAAELGGADMFWKYTDAVYETTTSNDTLDANVLPQLATKLGLDTAKFTACLDSGKYADKVKTSYDEALKAGAKGTPYTVIRFKGEFIPLVNDTGEGLGALPYEVVNKIVNQLLSQK
ncbi:thioredoxin domain-containing protein [Arenimonas sp.]|nr:thioredoxin domain-containing protein [Candidatus Parcubacteria bacterium]